MLENIGTPITDSYTFATGDDIDAYIRDIQSPKQDMNIDPTEGLSELEDLQEFDDAPFEKTDIQMKAAAAKASGRLVATVIDTALPQALAYIAKTPDSTPYKADPDSRQELEEALTEYMRLKGGDIPPGMMVLLLVLSIYLTKIPTALQQRKQNTALATPAVLPPAPPVNSVTPVQEES